MILWISYYFLAVSDNIQSAEALFCDNEHLNLCCPSCPNKSVNKLNIY